MGEKSIADRFAAIDQIIGGYGYRVSYQTGAENGTDWEVGFRLATDSKYIERVHHAYGATEDELIAYLNRLLPRLASQEWKSYAIALEGEIAELKRVR